MAEYNPSKIIKDGNTYNFRDDTKIPLAGSNQISGDLIPSTNGTVNLGSPSYQWNNAYIKSLTINGVACGDILTHNVSEFVNVTTAQTIGGAKTFYASTTAYPIIKLKTAFIEQGLYDSDNLRGVAFRCVDKNDAILGDFGYKTERTGEVGSYFSARTKVNNTQTTREVKLRFKPGSTDCELVPDTTNLIDLGTSTYKWKSLNGINPGALSLPSISSTGANAWIVLDTTDWVKNTAVANAQKYTPLADGWLNVRVDNATMLAIAVGGNYMHQIIRSETANSLALLMPVFKNTEVAIMTGGNENLAYNRVTFYYCQGNV